MSSREELKNYQLQLDQVIDGLSVVPDDQELLDLKAELTDLIDLLKEQLKAEEAEEAATKKKWQQKRPTTTSQTPSRTETPTAHSSGGEEHDSPEPASPKSEPHAVKIGDVVSAKWASGDGGYYPAKITQITGSSAHPFYTVQFIKWAQTMETLPAYSIKVLADDKKRKVTAAGFDKPKPPPRKLDPSVREAAEDKKKRRLIEKQELEKTKASWQKFATSGPRKRVGAVGRSVPIGSNSMFKTPESVEGRGMIPYLSSWLIFSGRRGKWQGYG
jgi:survival of motor neuron-related-splicing factor 30